MPVMQQRALFRVLPAHPPATFRFHAPVNVAEAEPKRRTCVSQRPPVDAFRAVFNSNPPRRRQSVAGGEPPRGRSVLTFTNILEVCPMVTKRGQLVASSARAPHPSPSSPSVSSARPTTHASRGADAGCDAASQPLSVNEPAHCIGCRALRGCSPPASLRAGSDAPSGQQLVRVTAATNRKRATPLCFKFEAFVERSGCRFLATQATIDGGAPTSRRCARAWVAARAELQILTDAPNGGGGVVPPGAREPAAFAHGSLRLSPPLEAAGNCGQERTAQGHDLENGGES
ncbi:unnamed protein product [Lampetra fluviatilis]